MHLRDDFGLSVAEADAAEALAAVRAGELPRAVVLRVPDPPEETWEELSAAGFVRKPVWLTWLTPTPTSDEDYVSRLVRKSRQDLRRAQRRAETAGLRIELRQPLRSAELDVFLGLYEQRVGQMRYGFAFASQYRTELLESTLDFAVVALDSDRLVGGVLCLECPEEDAVRLRFSAVEPRWRDASLARVLYLHAFRAARERGYRWVTLGNDPNLYGHVAKPGLFAFKARMGFEPVPAGWFGKVLGGDAADLLLSLDGLTDPALMLGYAPAGAAHDPAEPPPLTSIVFGQAGVAEEGRWTTRTIRTARSVAMGPPPRPSAA